MTAAGNPRVSLSIRSDTLPLELRSVTPKDASALLRIFSDEENIKHDQSAAGLNTLPAIEKLIPLWTNLTGPLTRLNLVVVTKGEVAGLSGIGHIYTRDDGRRIGDAGVMINPDARGKGYAYESLRITIDYSLRVLGLDEVTVEMREANVEMRELMDKQFRATVARSESLEFGNESSKNLADALPILLLAAGASTSPRSPYFSVNAHADIEHQASASDKIFKSDVASAVVRNNFSREVQHL